MSDSLLRTKLYIPPVRPDLVPRQRLMARLDQGIAPDRKLTLISAPAGFGKTTLVSAWIAARRQPAAWLSLEEEDSQETRFLAYLVAAIQTIAPAVGATVGEVLQSPQPPPTQALLATLLNDIATVADEFVLVLDDYHVIDAQAVDVALAYLVAHLPPQMHLVITTREDPPLPLARLRARGQMTEVRADDLRFTTAEAAAFLNAIMGLDLTAEQIAALEARTEGWIAGLQMAALALQGAGSARGQEGAAAFVASFSGSHRFVLDYLLEEVLEQQPEPVQTFLLRTAILDRLCGPLCDAVLAGGSTSGQETLAYLEQANLFVVPLDEERRWYRYHHLFSDLLRQRLEQGAGLPAGDTASEIATLHRRASIWYEANGLELAAFRHAVAARDFPRAARLVEGGGMPLHFRGAMIPVMEWLGSLPAAILDARPYLWVTYASALTMVGHPVSSVEEKLLAAEVALAAAVPPQDATAPKETLAAPTETMAAPTETLAAPTETLADDDTRDLIGQIAAIRAMLAVPQNEIETIITQARRALDYLRPDNVPVRTAATWVLGHAYQLQGDRVAAREAFSASASSSGSTGNIIFDIAATTGLGQLQEADNRLALAAETYQRVLQLAGEPPLPVACAAYLGLTRISYEWNDLEAARQHAQRSMELGRLLENIDAPAMGEIMLARVQLARGDVDGARATLARAERFVRRQHFDHRLPDIAAVQVVTLLRQGHLAAAADLAAKHDLPLSQARVSLAQGDPDAALAQLAPVRQQAEARGWFDEQLEVLVLQALARQARGEAGEAIETLAAALALAEPGGFVRLFVDEGAPMAALLRAGAQQGLAPRYVHRLQTAFAGAEADDTVVQRLPDPLTDRELQVLGLLATELSGPEIARELMVSLNTMRTHTKNIYSKLGVNSRRAAVRRAAELDLL